MVSVLQGIIDSLKSLHQSNAIDNAKFNLSNTVCWQIPDESMASSRVSQLQYSSEAVIEHRLALFLYEPFFFFFWQIVAPTVEVTNLDLRKSSMNLTILRPRFRESKALTMAYVVNVIKCTFNVQKKGQSVFLNVHGLFRPRLCSAVCTDLLLVCAWWDGFPALGMKITLDIFQLQGM